MIEIGPHPHYPTALMLHSTSSGQFMATDRGELIEFFLAAERGDFNGLLTPARTVTPEGTPQ